MSKKIIGVTVGSPLPKPNLKQTDPSKGDYVKGKDIIPTKVSQLENDAEYATEEYVRNKIAEAELGGEEVDLSGYAQKSELPTKVSQLQNDAGYLTQHQDLSGYAKTEDIPTTPADIGAQPAGNYALKSEIPSVPVKSVNGKTGAVTMSASDVGAMPSGTKIPSKTSDLTNDSGYITSYTESDPTVPAWAKASTKPTYSKSEVGLGNVDNVKQYSASNPPPYPVTSVNGKTGAVSLDAAAVGARPSTWMPNASDVGALPASTTIPTKVSQLTNDKGYLTEHQDISGKLDESELPTAINTALAQAKASGEFDGATGQRGTGLLPVTTAPSSYTTAVGGITPEYRMALSTIKTQAGVTEVLLGDTVRYSYYHYPIDYMDASYAYFENRVSIRGASGTSVTIESISESSEDGGNNVVTFSDDKTLTVKNGTAGYTPVRGKDYWTSADKAEIEAHIATELAKRGQLEPLYADSIEGCTDTTKMYVLPDGFIYAYMLTEKEVESGGGYTNVLPSATDTDRKTIYNGKGYSEGGKRLSSSGSESTTAVTNNAVTGFISAKVGDIVRIKGFWCPSGVSDYLISYNSSNTKVNYKTFNAVSGESSWGPGSQTWYTVADGVTTIQLTEANFGTGFDAIRFSGVITADTIVTINQEIKEGGGTTIVKEYAWTSTGRAFVPADYEDRIVALENDVANLKANGVDSGSGVDESRVAALETKTAQHDTKIANLETLTSQHSEEIAALKEAVENGASGGGTSGGSSGNTNLLPTAVDTDGSIYNGIGYKPSTRLSGSSGLTASSQEAMCASGFMPASDGNVVKIKGSSPVSGVSAYLITYDSSKSIIKYQTFSIGSTDWSTANQNWYTYADGVLTIPLTEANFGTDIAFFRFNAHMDENTVVTVTAKTNAGGSDNTSNLTPEEALALIRNWDSPIYDRVPVFQLAAENPAVPSAERTVPSIYAKYDALVAAHPNYITKKDLGVCSDGVTHVYRYDFCEPEPHHQSGQQWSETKPVIICASGIHWEWAGVYSLYYALKAITENAELDDLRRNVHFVVVPIINPYCFTDIGPYNQTYGVLNANGVQIHRNFEVGFKYPGTSGHVALGDRNHGGTEPLSEIETQNIDNIFKEFPDAALFMTCHSAQRDTRWGTGFIWASTATNYTCNLGYRLVDKMSKAWHKKYGTTWEEGCVRENNFVLADTATYPHATALAEGDYRAGHAHVSATDGTETRQATKYGIQGANVEVLEAFWVLDDTVLGSKVTTHGAEVYINYLLSYMGCYDHKDKKQYYIQ